MYYGWLPPPTIHVALSSGQWVNGVAQLTDPLSTLEGSRGAKMGLSQLVKFYSPSTTRSLSSPVWTRQLPGHVVPGEELWNWGNYVVSLRKLVFGLKLTSWRQRKEIKGDSCGAWQHHWPWENPCRAQLISVNSTHGLSLLSEPVWIISWPLQHKGHTNTLEPVPGQS